MFRYRLTVWYRRIARADKRFGIFTILAYCSIYVVVPLIRFDIDQSRRSLPSNALYGPIIRMYGDVKLRAANQLNEKLYQYISTPSDPAAHLQHDFYSFQYFEGAGRDNRNCDHLTYSVVSPPGKRMDYITKAPSTPPKIVCLVLTFPANIWRKAIYIHLGWSQLCDETLYVVTKLDRISLLFPGKLLEVETSDSTETYQQVGKKMAPMWQKVWELYSSSHDFFLVADDDTAVDVRVLREYLEDKDPDLLWYIGNHGCITHLDIPPLLMVYGGSGLVISRASLNLITSNGNASQAWDSCRSIETFGMGDVSDGVCLPEEAGVIRLVPLHTASRLGSMYTRQFLMLPRSCMILRSAKHRVSLLHWFVLEPYRLFKSFWMSEPKDERCDAPRFISMHRISGLQQLLWLNQFLSKA